MVSLFLAYKRGGFPDFPEGMDKEAFAREAAERIVLWDDAIVLEVGNPVGLVSIHMWCDHAMVRVFWFPWATLRNKIETMVNFILEFRNTAHLMAISDETDFMSHLFRYGVVRGIGYSKGADATIYEAVR